ncbi:single-stranded DNA-binding protein 4 isoform 2-T2 [Hipposideros larvatus]
MYAKGGKGSAVPSDSQAREKLALYVYEYLLHVGAQKSAQTFLSEIRWEKNITLGEPPGFLHSWWCVFWDLYCAAPDRREACEHSSEAKAFQDYSAAAAAPSPVMGSMAPNDAMAAGPMAPGFFQGPPGSQPPPHSLNTPMMGPHIQPPVGLPGSQPLLPGAMDPSPRAQGHPSMGPMQRVTPPRGMASVGPQSYGGGMRPPLNSLGGPGLPTMNMGSGVRGPWASPSGNSIPYSSSSPGSYTGPPGGGGPPGTPIMPSPGDSTNSSENMYTIMNPIGPGAGRANVSGELWVGGCWRQWPSWHNGGPSPTPPLCLQFPLGPGSEGPMAAMSALEPHHVNGSLGSGDMDGLPKSSPGAVAGLSTAPGTPRDDGEMAAAGTFLHPFPSESVSDCVDSPPAAASGRRGLAGRPRRGGRGGQSKTVTAAGQVGGRPRHPSPPLPPTPWTHCPASTPPPPWVPCPRAAPPP